MAELDADVGEEDVLEVPFAVSALANSLSFEVRLREQRLGERGTKILLPAGVSIVSMTEVIYF